MDPYSRKNPEYALCGLNCGLCPRFHTDGSSRCPGCGGSDFALKHPSCGVISCARKHGGIEFCFQCAEYPCEKYEKQSHVDSFMSYRNVIPNFQVAGKDLKGYLKNLGEKRKILEKLISAYNDGRAKGFYCLAVDLLPLAELKELMKDIEKNFDADKAGMKEAVKGVRALISDRAERLGIELTLRN